MASQNTPPTIHLSDEEDLGHPQLVRFDDDFIHSNTPGKGKHRDTQSPTPSDNPADAVAYPPISEDAEETRRIEENLRRWEIAERQRRKAARTSSTSTASASLVTNVSRRASLLWAGRKTRNSSLGGFSSTHTALESRDNIDILPLTDINISPTPSPTHSEYEETQLTDPFANPSESTSPFADSQESYASSSLIPSDPSPSSALSSKTFSSAAVSQTPHPPPKPLDLPPPRTPPPIAGSPDPLFAAPDSILDQDTQPTKWWHEWLCGCGEGPDRGGDNQAGRTNPFE